MPKPTSHRVRQQRGSELMAGVSRQGAGVNEVIKGYKRGKAGTAKAAGAGEIILESKWEEKERESRTDPILKHYSPCLQYLASAVCS